MCDIRFMKTYKIIAIVIAAFLLVIGIAYAAFSFVYMSLNPLNWTPFGRGFFALLVVCLSCSTAIRWLENK